MTVATSEHDILGMQGSARAIAGEPERPRIAAMAIFGFAWVVGWILAIGWVLATILT